MDTTQPPLICSNPDCQQPISPFETLHVRWRRDDDGTPILPMLPFHGGCAPAVSE